jgi:predicted RNase H-like HicB family nuclease
MTKIEETLEELKPSIEKLDAMGFEFWSAHMSAWPKAESNNGWAVFGVFKDETEVQAYYGKTLEQAIAEAEQAIMQRTHVQKVLGNSEETEKEGEV